MSDGAARLLQMHLSNNKKNLDPVQRKVLQNAFQHLISRDPDSCWTSGQWMTERTGGSDVSLTETVARQLDSTTTPSRNGAVVNLANAEEGIPLGPWSISGFKWFSSATDSAMTILLAKTTKGISAFFAPMRRQNSSLKTMVGRSNPQKTVTELNGVRIQRLKNKFGTQSLPTAELELNGMRAWLLGEEGRGIQEIGAVLTITRIHSTVACLGYVGRGLGVAKAYAKVRQVGAGKGRRMFLTESALHMRTLAKLTTEYHGLMLLNFYTTYILGMEEHPEVDFAIPTTVVPSVAGITPQAKHVSPLLRVLTPLLKAYACKKSIGLMYACMESLGGIGYLLNQEQEYLNLARLFRDLSVNSIWEGTTDVLATDFVRALKHPKGGRDCIDALDALFLRQKYWVSDGIPGLGAAPGRWTPLTAWGAIKERIESLSQDDLVGDARDILWAVAEALVGMLMAVDYRSDGSKPAGDMLADFVAQRSIGSILVVISADETLARDKAIVYGWNEPRRASAFKPML
jgi:alkylation response protein AidB-like acyl-CoA dehydrogenase